VSVALVTTCVALIAALLPGRADAVVTAPAVATATWMATQVQPDGSVIDPYSTLPSVDWAVNVALGLAATGTQPDALNRALGYIHSHASAYVTGGGSDVVGRYAWLTLLAHAVGDDPHAFGTPPLDLIAGIGGRLGVAEPGLYGTVDEYTPVTNQSLAILALTAVGDPVPPAAVQWLLDQQCTAPVLSQGAWEGYRGPSGGGLVACDPSDSSNFTSADSNSTAMAVMALEAVGSTPPVLSALAWLHTLQTTSGIGVGGFGQRVGDSGDPNSTALVVLAIVAAGENPSSSLWTAGAVSAENSLVAWQITSGAEFGAIASPYSSGFADLFATYQAIWGLVPVTFPFLEPTAAPTAPPDPTTTTTTMSVSAGVVTPRFTG
jgi:hypothetical protein